MRISDWSSDVCSSDLFERVLANTCAGQPGRRKGIAWILVHPGVANAIRTWNTVTAALGGAEVVKVVDREIGRASGRERVCQYVSISVGAVSLKKKNK